MQISHQYQQPLNLIISPVKRRIKQSNRFENTLKKNQQIIDNYLSGNGSPQIMNTLTKRQNANSNQGYYIIEKQKLHELKQKLNNQNSVQYVMLNSPNSQRYKIKRSNTQNRDYNDYNYNQNQQTGEYLTRNMYSIEKPIQLYEKQYDQLSKIKKDIKNQRNNQKNSRNNIILPIISIEGNKNIYSNMEMPTLIRKKSKNIQNKYKIINHPKYLSLSKIQTQPNNNDEDLSELQQKVQRLRRQIRQQKLKSTQPLIINQYPYRNVQNLKNNLKNHRKYLPVINTKNIKVINPLTSPKNLFNLKYVKSPFQPKYILNSDYLAERSFIHLNDQLNDPLEFVRTPRQIFGKLRKVANSIRFVINLTKFSQRLRIKRQCYFKDSVQQNIYSQIINVKDYFLKSTMQFITKLSLNNSTPILIIATDSSKQRENKINQTRQYLNLFLDQIGQIEFKKNIIQIIAQMSYYVCKHGGAGAVNTYFTAEELDLMSINKQTLKIRAQKNLQKSQITAFIWVKLILFNIMLRSSKLEELKNLNQQWNSNFFLLGSLIYQISKIVQRNLIIKVPEIYEIGNWKYINFLNSKEKNNIKKQIVPCKSMIINENLHQKLIKIEENSSELVKGTISKNYLSQAYQFEKWEIQYKKILSVTNFIHKKICDYHRNLQKGLI